MATLFASSAESQKCVGYFADAIHHFYRPRELAALLEGIGFDNVENRDFLTGVMSYHIARKTL
jgi:demethylmenaquinone methyltransferase/2-methoxy-6-polyprenyl-1,4-benzoquinol methylase